MSFRNIRRNIFKKLDKYITRDVWVLYYLNIRNNFLLYIAFFTVSQHFNKKFAFSIKNWDNTITAKQKWLYEKNECIKMQYFEKLLTDIYTSNAVESVNFAFRKVTRGKKCFPF